MKPREVKITLRVLVIKDTPSGEEFTVRTLRTAQDIAAYVEESEKEEVVSELEQMVSEAYQE